MSKDTSFLREQNEILRSKLKQVQQELAEAKIQVQKRDVRIQMLENELRHQSRFKESRSEVLTSHSGYFRGNYDQQEESLNNLTTVSELTPTEMMMPELKESATSLSFDSAIFGKPASNADEHRPLINMDFRLPEFNKSRLFGGKKVLPAEVPLKPITHNQLSESDFAGITKTKTVLAQQKQNGVEKNLFKCFLVTGMKGIEPTIEYSYPIATDHSETILTLLFPEQPLRIKEKTKSMTEINKVLVSSPLKDMFVIALKQTPGESTIDEYQYVIGCETEDIMFRESSYYTYNRYYCFLSDYKCIKLFMEVLTEIASTTFSYLECVQSKRQFYLLETHDNEERLEQSLTEPVYINYFQELLKQEVEPKLQRLLNNKFEYNQHLRVRWSTEKVIMEEIPAKENESQLIFGYEPAVRLHNYRISYCIDHQHPSYQQNLITFVCVYMMCEKRLVIYSNSKEKVSLLLLLVLETIKPLQFVNPILQGCVRESYSDYLDAPMSIVMGMWAERRAQKLEVSLRKPPKKSMSFTFGDVIEHEKLRIKDGVTVNLDSQKAYGDMDTQLNFIVSCLTRELARNGEKPEYRCRALNSLFLKVFNNELTMQWATLLKKRLKETQMYNYYTQKS